MSKTLKTERDQQLYSTYLKLKREKILGVQKYRYEAILRLVGKKFYLAPMTVKEIILEVAAKKKK
jgi:hypothetical protein